MQNDLKRYGIMWNHPTLPIAVEMDDGYWTPYHIANMKISRLKECLLKISLMADDRGNVHELADFAKSVLEYNKNNGK